MSTTEQPSSTAAPADLNASESLRIFVGNLPLSADAKALKTVFRETETRAQVRVNRITRSPHGKCRYAIVTFKSEEDKNKGVHGLAEKFENGESESSPDTPEAADSAPKNGDASAKKLQIGVAPPKPKVPKAENGGAPSASKAEPRAKSAKPRRAPAKFVPRPSAVYVSLPPHTEADEVRELLSGFPSVEIKLGHKRGRTVTRRTKHVDIPDRTYAVVTVGEEHQQRAIEQLDGKLLRDFRISAKPSSQRLLTEDAKEEAREAKKEDEAAPEAQPNAEHAEHAEQTAHQSAPSA